MVEIIAGEKGKGKTKYLLDKVNDSVKAASGNIVYLDKSQKHMYELNNKVRLINVTDFPITNCDEFLGFIDEIGRTRDGGYIYRFDFTLDTETIWGEYFNVTPSAIIPDLQADRNALTRQAKAIFPREMVIAKRNYCFSMQDCIDGIIPLMFSEIDDNTLLLEDKPFFLKFGTPFDEVEEKLKSIGISFFDIEEVEKGDDSAIDNLINSIDEGDGEEDDDNFDDDNF